MKIAIAVVLVLVACDAAAAQQRPALCAQIERTILVIQRSGGVDRKAALKILTGLARANGITEEQITRTRGQCQ